MHLELSSIPVNSNADAYFLAVKSLAMVTRVSAYTAEYFCNKESGSRCGLFLHTSSSHNNKIGDGGFIYASSSAQNII